MLQYFALVAVMFGAVSTDTEAPQWSSDYATALKQTRSDDRPMLVVIDEPGVAEKSLDEQVLTNMAGGALADYQLCHVDATTSYGKKVAEAFKAELFPYIAITDKAGKVILHSQAGEVTADEWNTMVTKYRTGALPVKHVTAKPVVESQPASYLSPSYEQYQPYGTTAKPYCARCQRGY